MKGQRNHTRKETRDNLKQCSLALELARILKHFFPDLLLCFAASATARSQTPKLYHLSGPGASNDTNPFFSMLHQQHAENK